MSDPVNGEHACLMRLDGADDGSVGRGETGLATC